MTFFAFRICPYLECYIKAITQYVSCPCWFFSLQAIYFFGGFFFGSLIADFVAVGPSGELVDLVGQFKSRGKSIWPK